MDTAFGHWLAGFVAGEGCFLIQRDSSQWNYGCAFELKLRADDREILDEMQRETGCGTVREAKFTPIRFANPQAIWRVGNRADVFRLTEILDRYPLRAKKRHDYTIWREAVHEWRRIGGRGKGRADWSRMAAFKEALESGRRFSTDSLPAPSPFVASPQLVLLGKAAA